MKLKKIADFIAKSIKRGTSTEDIRDQCDLATYGDLGWTQLDVLTSMVIKRLGKKI